MRKIVNINYQRVNGLKIVPIGTNAIHCHHCYIDLKSLGIHFVESFQIISNSFCKFSETPLTLSLKINPAYRTPLEIKKKKHIKKQLKFVVKDGYQKI